MKIKLEPISSSVKPFVPFRLSIDITTEEEADQLNGSHAVTYDVGYSVISAVIQGVKGDYSSLEVDYT